jgi:acyl carrier protein
MNILDDLNQIFREIFNRKNIELNYETTAKDIAGWDSITHISIIVSVENHFEIKFSIVEIINMKNIGDLIRLIEIKTTN